jgi:ubiquinone biosynthesis protein
MMEKANQALTFMASGKIPQESKSFSALNEKKIEMKMFRNQSIIGLLLLVFVGIIVF